MQALPCLDPRADPAGRQGEKVEGNKQWNVFASPILENMGSKISLIILRDYAALMIAKVTNKKKKILTSEGLEDDDCM
ncbi:hypothetical protein IEQ34_002380 [Dendrobium chrysotoxum]|uniref:Uncharacterized protein n=1 Tax=Dendrobium chrysotoxum TaxID=161865 RepID=A0AAV7HN99_DENCH|nr:hypothetical protein IEQ34_002380 [Dendrobium chrysotoxum]